MTSIDRGERRTIFKPNCLEKLLPSVTRFSGDCFEVSCYWHVLVTSCHELAVPGAPLEFREFRGGEHS